MPVLQPVLPLIFPDPRTCSQTTKRDKQGRSSFLQSAVMSRMIIYCMSGVGNRRPAGQNWPARWRQMAPERILEEKKNRVVPSTSTVSVLVQILAILLYSYLYLYSAQVRYSCSPTVVYVCYVLLKCTECVSG